MGWCTSSLAAGAFSSAVASLADLKALRQPNLPHERVKKLAD
jgi:hypothetical protein